MLNVMVRRTEDRTTKWSSPDMHCIPMNWSIEMILLYANSKTLFRFDIAELWVKVTWRLVGLCGRRSLCSLDALREFMLGQVTMDMIGWFPGKVNAWWFQGMQNVRSSLVIYDPDAGTNQSECYDKIIWFKRQSLHMTSLYTLYFRNRNAILMY